MEPEPRGPMTKGAQRRALLAEALLRRGASFRHLRLLSLPWRGSKGAAPAGAEGEVAEEKEEEPAVQGEAGGPPVAEEMDEDVSEGEAPPPEVEEMNALSGNAPADGDERSGLARVRRLDKSKSSHLPPGVSDVSSLQPQTANRDHSQGERESESGTANQSRVNSLAGQWEPGGEDASLMLNPPPPIESCLEVPRGGVAERGEGEEGAGRAGPGEGSPRKDLIG